MYQVKKIHDLDDVLYEFAYNINYFGDVEHRIDEYVKGYLDALEFRIKVMKKIVEEEVNDNE